MPSPFYPATRLTGHNALRVRKNIKVLTFICLIVCLPILIAGCYNVKDEIISAQQAVKISDLPTTYMTYSITPVTGSNDYRFINTPGNNAPQESGYARAVLLKNNIYIVQIKYDNDAKYVMMFLKVNNGAGGVELTTVFPEVKVDPSRYNVRIETAGYFDTKLIGRRENIMAFLKAHAGANFNGEPAAVSAFKEKALAAESPSDFKPLMDLVNSATAYMQHAAPQAPPQVPTQAPAKSAPQTTAQLPTPVPATSQNTETMAPKAPLPQSENKNIHVVASSSIAAPPAPNVPAVRKGDAGEVFKQYLAEFAINGHNGPLRTKIIDLAKSLYPRPAIPAEARRLMAQGIDEFKKADDPAGLRAAGETIWKAMRAAPWWANAYFNLALVQHECGYYVAEADSLKTYLQISPHGHDADTIKQRLVLAQNAIESHQQTVNKTKEGYELFHDNNLAGAVECFKEAIALDPKYVTAHTYLAETYKALGQYKEAIPEFYEGLRLDDEKDLFVYVSLAWCLGEAENNNVEEVTVLLTGLEKDPKNKEIESDGNPLIAIAYHNLAIADGKLKDYTSAIAFMEQSIADGYKDSDKARGVIETFKKRMSQGE
jgi:tetratricopeptide (TPR) repeat protein